jgi:hypothetical protein
MVKALPVHLRVLPDTRGDCRDGVRPCPLVSCRHHLLLDVSEDGRLLLTRDLDEDDADSIVDALATMPETCSLDVADRGECTSEVTARMLGLGVNAIEKLQIGASRAVRASGMEFDEREHPEDFYVRYSNMGADELAEVASALRARTKFKGKGDC